MPFRFAVCRSVPCERWGPIPKGFDERKHILKCPECGTGMMPTIHNPLEAAYKESKQVLPLIVSQK